MIKKLDITTLIDRKLRNVTDYVNEDLRRKHHEMNVDQHHKTLIHAGKTINLTHKNLTQIMLTLNINVINVSNAAL